MKKALIPILVAVFLSLGASGCTPKPSPTVNPSGANEGISQAKQRYTESLAKAHDWQRNATLERVYRTYEGTMTPEGGAATTYTFASLAEPTHSFEVTFAGDGALTTKKSTKQSFELAFNPIDTAEWSIDPDKALQVAEDAGGRTFREQHLAGFKVSQNLQQKGTFPVMWYFRYDTGDGTRLRHEIFVNAKTGEIANQLETTI